ncbi:FHA domain-containing protein [Lichenibacterium ramalinae]|uniref:FHA domain-containing protein n=1 Tax=Lichenibacterium ramalinae TaxID=2316527 RepID=A0A4Q2R7E2_9HYPH|nr:FHA domain-containing protein [Lichenibacterium ramalinae]
MGLVLRALDGDGGERAVPGGKPFLMGRGPDNDWVLDDPAREISKVHCRIDEDGRAHLITDLSINGVHLEREGRVLGRGNRHRLAVGDVFAVGPHRFAVAEADAGRAEPAPGDTPGAVGDILGGRGAGAEARAAAALSGEAEGWLGALPVKAADAGLARPLGWDGPPAAGSAHLPADFDAPASPLADAAEHAPATSTALHAPRPAQVPPAQFLPADWLDGAEDGSTPAHAPPPASAMRDAAPAADAGAARRGLLEGARVDPAALSAARDPALFGRAGRLLRALLDGLDGLEAAQAAAEHGLGIAPPPDASLWNDVLSSARDPIVKLLSDDEEDALGGLARRLGALADRQRALGAAMAEAAGIWDHRLGPGALADVPVPWFAAGPIGRAALWDRYAEAHAALCRDAAGPDGAEPGHPLAGLVRRAFARRLSER